tara:strand:+ start:172 stop:471 length:300 start_codon:yes stop_codon:yes gene_type:complete
VKILTDKNLKFETIEYLKLSMTKEELTKISNLLGLKPKDFIRRNEIDFKNLNYDSDSLNDDNLIIESIIKYPKILERPIVIANGKAIVGRPPERILEIL